MRVRIMVAPVLGGLAVALAACGSPVTASPVTTAGTASAAAATPASDPASSAAATAGTLGDTFTVTDSGNGDAYAVTLVKVIDPAHGSDEFSQPDAGRHFAAAVFTITGQAGHASDDANNDAVASGSDGQEYTAAFDTIAGYTNFANGEWNVSPGVTVKGAVTFALPDGVTVASVQWGEPFSGTPATWNLKAGQ